MNKSNLKIKNVNIAKESDLSGVDLFKEKSDVVLITLPIYKEDVILPFSEKSKNANSEEKIKLLAGRVNQFLNQKSLLFVYGSPIQLIKFYENISPELVFRYWISLDVIDSIEEDSSTGLKHNHLGVLMLSNGSYFPKINTKETRTPHTMCTSCGLNVKDWGGKKHLMNQNGTGLSDVWKDFYAKVGSKKDPFINEIKLLIQDTNNSELNFNQEDIPTPVLNRIYSLVEVGEKRKILNLKISKKWLKNLNDKNHINNEQIAESKVYKTAPRNEVILGDSIKIMEEWVKKYPDGIFDLVFADPPYNLEKDYKAYADDLAEKEYIQWCDRWLELCAKLTRKGGSIFILNIPKWSLSHSLILNKHAYLKNWVVWDALAMPKGKIMPAHYSLLYYTKSPHGTFNKPDLINSPEYCFRNSCIKNRLSSPHIEKENKKIPVSDIWWDVFRIKHKKDRDDHPCQLPDKLMDRIINTFSNPGDLVFDPFGGAGTTALRAIVNKRDYLTTEIDPYYKKITDKKIQELIKHGSIERKTVSRIKQSSYTKKELELKAQMFTQKLGRKPNLEEFLEEFKIKLEDLSGLYKDPKNVLKAGRMTLVNG